MKIQSLGEIINTVLQTPKNLSKKQYPKFLIPGALAATIKINRANKARIMATPKVALQPLLKCTSADKL